MRQMRYSITAGLLIAATVGCADAVGPDARRPAGPRLPSTQQPAPRVDAGPDLFVALPDSSLRLRAWGLPSSDPMPFARWTKLSGPASYRLTDEYGFAPLLSGLERGVYTFEVAVNFGLGHLARDTIAVHVVDSTAVRALDFLGQTWICPMGCTVSLGNIERQLPEGALMRVFARTGGVMTWEEVASVGGDRFIYSRSGGNLTLYTEVDPQPVDVRVLWMVP